eukprot:gene1061-10580_t
MKTFKLCDRKKFLRTFFNPFQKESSGHKFYEKRILGYSPKQVYDVVIDVNEYKNFVPLCQDSKVLFKKNGKMEAELVVNYKIGETSYVSKIDFEEDNFVKVMVKDDEHWLFKRLINSWEFTPGPVANSCTLNFHVDFEFTSILYQSLAETFISTSLKTMTLAFEQRCKKLYGSPSIPTTQISTSHE